MDEEEYGIYIVQEFTEVPLEALYGTMRRYAAAAEKAFFTARAGVSRTVTKQPPFASGSRAGEERPTLDVEHTWINGATRNSASFVAHFADGRFVSAEVCDLFGVERILRADYTPDALSTKRQPKEPEAAHARREKQINARSKEEDQLYNDGETYTLHRRVLTSATDFENWLVQFDQTFVPRKAPTRKAANESD